jgi:hypothetical protein
MLAGRGAGGFNILQRERALGAHLNRGSRLRALRRGRKPDRRGQTEPKPSAADVECKRQCARNEVAQPARTARAAGLLVQK